MAIVLASQSPRRQELLARIGVEDFKTLSLDIDESYPEGLSPEDTVRYIAKKKCDAAAALCAPICPREAMYARSLFVKKRRRKASPRFSSRSMRPTSHRSMPRPLMRPGPWRPR